MLRAYIEYPPAHVTAHQFVLSTKGSKETRKV